MALAVATLIVSPVLKKSQEGIYWIPSETQLLNNDPTNVMIRLTETNKWSFDSYNVRLVYREQNSIIAFNDIWKWLLFFKLKKVEFGKTIIWDWCAFYNFWGKWIVH